MRLWIKRLFFIMVFVHFSFIASFVRAESVSISTYYPSPFGSYRQLRLYPDSDGVPGLGSDCTAYGEGAMYYDDIDNHVLICDGNQWQQIGGSYWIYDDPGPSFEDYLYPKFSNVHIGIGTTQPEFQLSLGEGPTADGGIYLKGEAGGTTWQNVGSGPHLIFYGSGAVFRVGYACSNEWDAANINSYSAALGYCANAHSWSVAIGSGARTITTTSWALAIGSDVYAEGDHTTALGVEVTALENIDPLPSYSTAIGQWVEVQADNASYVIGKGIDNVDRLRNDVNNSLMVGFNSDVPSFIVGSTDLMDGTDSVGIWMDALPDPSIYALYVNGPAGGTTCWNSHSDERLKKNIHTIDNALDKVMKLRGVNFQWKNPDRYSPGNQIGIIAQEAKDIIPEVINDKDEYYSIQYEPIVALLIEAIKEQQKEIEELKAKIAARKQN